MRSAEASGVDARLLAPLAGYINYFAHKYFKSGYVNLAFLLCCTLAARNAVAKPSGLEAKYGLGVRKYRGSSPVQDALSFRVLLGCPPSYAQTAHHQSRSGETS